MQFISNNVNETIDFAEELAKSFKGGEVLALGGELGAGKTHFAKGIAKGLKITDTITSPTFTLMQQYQGENLTLYHCDMYRVAESSELYETGFIDAINDLSGICVIEWAENIKDILPKNIININIEITGTDTRIINIENFRE